MEQLYQYDYNTELLLKRLSDASQCKIYPAIVPRTEIPLRKVLLTTRLWNQVRRQQTLLSMAADEWIFNQQQPQPEEETFVYNTTEEEINDIPTTTTEDVTNCLISTTDWTWLNNQESLKRPNEDQLEQNTFKKQKSSNTSSFDNLMNNILVSSA